MNVLVTGRGNSGSWKIRGEQLGAAIGAVVTQAPTLGQLKAADLIIVVKRVQERTLALIRKSGTPWVFDALDFYPQPGCAAWSREEAIGWVRGKLERYAPNAIIWPNRKMRDDCGQGWNGFVLKHHHLPGIRINPIRREVQVVGYEGCDLCISAWRPQIEYECQRRGWRFTVNPDHLASVDIVLALRSGNRLNYVTQNWKSNVKLANAHGSGTPFVGQREAGYAETTSGAEYWTESVAGLGVCFEWLQSQSTREQVSDRFLKRAYTINQAASDLLEGLRGV